MKRIRMISIAIFIFIVALSCASAGHLGLEKMTNAHADEMTNNEGTFSMSSSDIFDFDDNAKEDSGSGLGSVKSLPLSVKSI